MSSSAKVCALVEAGALAVVVEEGALVEAGALPTTAEEGVLVVPEALVEREAFVITTFLTDCLTAGTFQLNGIVLGSFATDNRLCQMRRKGL